MPVEMLNGLGIMVVGMTVVFSFLIVMVMVMKLSSIVIGQIAKHFVVETPASKTKQSGQNREMEVAAAIAVARAQMQS